MWCWIFVDIFLGLFCATLAVVPTCPPIEDVRPCTCDSDGYYTSVECVGIRTINDVYPVLKSTKGLNISYAFRKSKLVDIPSDFFDGQQSVGLYFEKCQIGSFGKRPFTGLEKTLKRLSIEFSVDKRKKDLETFRLSHMERLEYLDFEGNDIKRLGNDWFESGPASLSVLMLEANDIEELGDRAFASLVNLQQIWLGDNSFKKISRSMFPRPADKLELMEISFCGIEELPEDLFKDMPSLKIVNVSGNKLVSAPEATWGDIWSQLDEVYLERNRGLKCDENLKWIYKQKLPRIFTGACTDEKNYGKKLKDLTLSDFE